MKSGEPKSGEPKSVSLRRITSAARLLRGLTPSGSPLISRFSRLPVAFHSRRHEKGTFDGDFNQTHLIGVLAQRFGSFCGGAAGGSGIGVGDVVAFQRFHGGFGDVRCRRDVTEDDPHPSRSRSLSPALTGA